MGKCYGEKLLNSKTPGFWWKPRLFSGYLPFYRFRFLLVDGFSIIINPHMSLYILPIYSLCITGGLEAAITYIIYNYTHIYIYRCVCVNLCHDRSRWNDSASCYIWQSPTPGRNRGPSGCCSHCEGRKPITAGTVSRTLGPSCTITGSVICWLVVSNIFYFP